MKEIESIKKMVRDLRDDTPCDEESHGHCGCEKFDEIIDELDSLITSKILTNKNK